MLTVVTFQRIGKGWFLFLAVALSRILYISYACPTPARLGPARRHYHILQQLSRFYDVDFLSLARPDEAAAFLRHCRGLVSQCHFARLQGNRTLRLGWKLWRTFTRRCDFLPVLEPDLIQLCRKIAPQGRYDAIFLSGMLLRGLPLPENVPVIGDNHNVEFDVLRRTSKIAAGVLRRQYARLQSECTRRAEQQFGRKVDLILATSERDRCVFESELGLNRVAVIPNGIDLAEFCPAPLDAGEDTILFTGLMSYYPNQQAAAWFLKDIFPQLLAKRPRAKLIIAGAAPPRWLLPARSAHVQVTGAVPDIRPYLVQANVVIAPLMIGGGTRVKILEAQAMAKPVVSTSTGAEGLTLHSGHSISLADDPDSFASQLVRLLSDPALAAAIGLAGRRHVEEHYNWERIGEDLASLLHSRMGLGRRTARVQAMA